MSLQEIMQKKLQELMQLDKSELASRLAFLEIALDRINPMIKELINNMFGLFVGYYRSGMPIRGILLGFDAEIKQFLVYKIEDRREYGSNKVHHEESVKWIPKGSLMDWEIIKISEEKTENKEE